MSFGAISTLFQPELSNDPRSSVNSYKKNSNQNGYTVDTLDQETIDEMYDSKWTTPGVFTIPVCGEYEAGHNWWAHSNSGKGPAPKHYPCN